MESSLLPPVTASEAPPLPTTKKPRRKAREVSSRYMPTPSPSPMAPPPSASSTPLHSSSSLFGHHHLPKHRRCPSSVPSSPEATDTESDSNSRFADENQPLSRSLETPSFLGAAQGSKISGAAQTKKRAIRLFGDNGGGGCGTPMLHQSHHHQPQQQPPKPNFRKARPGTPMAICPVDGVTTAAATPKGAVLSSAQVRIGRNAAAKGLKSEASAHSRASPFSFDDPEADTCSTSSQGGFCESPPIMGSRIRQQGSEFRSSMPEADLLPTMSSRRALDVGGSSRQNDGNESSCCSRSLNLAPSASQQNPFHNKAAGRIIPSKICLPPQPPSSRLEGELKKGRKGSSRQDDIHMLRLLHNRNLQWRFVNAKAEEAVDAWNTAAERSLYGLSAKLSEMQSSVEEKRSEVERLKRLSSLSSILDRQMPSLEKWSTLQEDYSSSLAGVTKALQDASIRLPISGNVRANANDLKEVFDYTTNIFESLSACVQRFVPKAGVLEEVSSNLAELAITEKTLIQECGNLLSEAHTLQVIECSLRSQLMQEKHKDCC